MREKEREREREREKERESERERESMTWESIVNNCDLLLFACFSKPQKSSRLGNV